MKKLIKIKCPFGIFDYSVTCVVGDYVKAVKYIAGVYNEDKSEAKDLEIRYGGNSPRGQCFYKDGYVPIVWIPRKPTTPREYGTLAHECFHAVVVFMAWAHINCDMGNDEVAAHSVGYLVSKILKELR